MSAPITPSADSFELLARAVRANDTSLARRLLERDTSIRAHLDEAMPGGAFGETTVIHAVKARNLELVDVLVAHGADIDQRSHWWAGSFGVLDICDPALAVELIARGARVDAHATSRLGMLDRLDEIVSADPSVVHARGGDGQTPLHFAANVELAQYLVEHRANVNARDVDHESTPAQWMIRDRHEVARWLVDHGATADILMAAALGDAERVRVHLAQNPAAIRTRVDAVHFPMSDPRAGGSIYIWTLGANKFAHSVARAFRRQNVYDLLVEQMPDTMRLALACEAVDEETARSLIASEPGLLERTVLDHGYRLGDMAWEGNTAAALLMLDLGWPIGAPAGAATPLHQAAWMGDAALVRELLRHGADVNAIESQFNGTPLAWAQHGAENNGGRGDPTACIAMLSEAAAR